MCRASLILIATFAFYLQGCFTAKKNAGQGDFYLKEIDHGLYSENSIETQTKDTPSGIYRIINGFDLLKSCDTVQARLGLIFGISYTIHGAKSDSVWITSKWKLPVPMMNNEGRRFEVIKRNTKRNVNTNQITNYKFDEKFEMMPGTWTLQLYDGKRLLLEKKFIVVLPQ